MADTYPQAKWFAKVDSEVAELINPCKEIKLEVKIDEATQLTADAWASLEKKLFNAQTKPAFIGTVTTQSDPLHWQTIKSDVFSTLPKYEYKPYPYYGASNQAHEKLPHRCKYIVVGDKEMLMVDEPGGRYALIPVVAKMVITDHEALYTKDKQGFWQSCYERLVHEIAKRFL